MKTLIVVLATLIIVSIAGISVASPLCHMSSKASFAGFINQDDCDKFFQLVRDKDYTAADNYLAELLRLRTATMFEKGETVYVEDLGGWVGDKKVRRPGETQSYWTHHDAAEC